MSFASSMSRSASIAGLSISTSNTYTGDQVAAISETVADATVDAEFLMSIDVSRLQTFGMISTADITVEINSGSAPTQTFNLTANKAVTWQVGEVAVLTADVTAIYITNASGSAATVRIAAQMTN